MSTLIQVEVGDYLRVDGIISEVVNVTKFDEEWTTFFLADGRVCGPNDITIDDVLLPSEVL